jgi:hypothetical protein
MKTQISSLVNGSKNVIGRSIDFKGGSNHALRSEIAKNVHLENMTELSVEVRGVHLKCVRSSSVSGKTITYNCEISKDQYKSILGFKTDITLDSSFTFVINNDMTCQIDTFARKNEKCDWQHRGYNFLSESLFTIQ